VRDRSRGAPSHVVQRRLCLARRQRGPLGPSSPRLTPQWDLLCLGHVVRLSAPRRRRHVARRPRTGQLAGTGTQGARCPVPAVEGDRRTSRSEDHRRGHPVGAIGNDGERRLDLSGEHQLCAVVAAAPVWALAEPREVLTQTLTGRPECMGNRPRRQRLLDVVRIAVPSVSILLGTPLFLLLHTLRACQGAHDDHGDLSDATDFRRLAAA
jgi:hypothetical protein